MLQGLIGPAIVAAAVAGLIAFGREIFLLREDRRQRRRDLSIAVAAEIRAYVASLERDRIAEYGDAMAARIRAGGDDEHRFVPFIPQERNATVFRALLPRIDALPEEAVDSVTLFYQQLFAIEALIEDMRAPAYAALSVERRADVYESYVSMKVEALELGHAALSDLGREIGQRYQ